jgi:hypothetical protein
VVCRLSLVTLIAFFLLAQTDTRAQEVIVPAGTTVQCTLEDAKLSSKTAAPDDPILCDTGNLREFGVSVFPRGAYLEGRFTGARDPGRLWGKGWMLIEFDHILLPGAELPIATRVTSIPHSKVDLQGKIHGTGHAGRDAMEWAIPVLWPEKVLTLPMRGPRPVLKQETRITLKLMEPLTVPQGVAEYQTQAPLLRPGAFRPSPPSASRPGERAGLQPAVRELPPATSMTRATADPMLERISLVSTSTQERASTEGTLLILTDGSAQLVKNYWFDSGQKLQFVSPDGHTGAFPIEALDLATTVKLNRERGVSFVIGSKASAR